MTEEELSKQTGVVLELLAMAKTPEQVEFLSTWNQNQAVIDVSKMQEALRSQREQIKRLEYDMQKEEQIYIKIIKAISSGEY